MAQNRIEGTGGADSLVGSKNADLIYGYDTAAADAAVTGLTLTLITPAVGGTRPVGVEHAPGDGDHLFVPTINGRIDVIDLATGQTLANPLLDLTGSVAVRKDMGFTGLAFDPDFAQSGKFYVYYSKDLTDGTTDQQIWEYQVSASNPLVADPASARLVASWDQPGHEHLFGWITFGPDGYLYVTRGDAENPYDVLQVAQDPDSLLGKVLRIDVHGADAFPADPDRNYAIPPQNPFADGVDGAPEVWGIGVRNAFRGSFDQVTGDFWNGDVGQVSWEEVNHVAGGTQSVNFGWGYQGWEGNVQVPGGTLPADGLLFPVDTYFHDNASASYAVTAGYVYRGGSEGLQGQFFYADFGQSFVRTLSDPEGDGSYARTDWTASITYANTTVTLKNPDSFGEDAEGNLYVLGIGGALYRVEATTGGPADGADTVSAGKGDDWVFAGGGNDSVSGGAGDDSLLGMAGADTLVGDAGDDFLSGGLGNDSLSGGNGNDTQFGGDGNDVVASGAGDDVLDGGAGADTVIGGAGTDLLRGGAGNDKFVFKSGESPPASPDSILDFATGDLIDVGKVAASIAFIGTGAFTATGAAELHVLGAAFGSLVEIDTDGNGIADAAFRVVGVASLAASDFAF